MPGENHSTRPSRPAMIRGMFRYAILAAPSAVADAPKAAVNDMAAAAVAATTAAVVAAAAPLGGARS